jgi:GNAT superfamily N-acetyltransferase
MTTSIAHPDELGSTAAVGQVDTVVTYLEMTLPPASAGPVLPAGVEVRHARRPTVAFYRYLYEIVGGPWMWTERRLLSDQALAQILGDPRVEVNVLWVDGVPAGYAELDRRQPSEVELAYFGVAPSFIGRGLGRLLLAWAIRHAWRSKLDRLWVHTCDLDHPRALDVYRSAGFQVCDRRDEQVALVTGLPLPEHRRRRAVDE